MISRCINDIDLDQFNAAPKYLFLFFSNFAIKKTALTLIREVRQASFRNEVNFFSAKTKGKKKTQRIFVV